MIGQNQPNIAQIFYSVETSGKPQLKLRLIFSLRQHFCAHIDIYLPIFALAVFIRFGNQVHRERNFSSRVVIDVQHNAVKFA